MNEKFMKEAIKEAHKAQSKGDVPIGCVIVLDGKIIARGHNKKENTQNPLHHAELIAIEKAAKALKSWRLIDTEMYVTLEPCLMCSGAIINSRIDKLYFGAFDKRFGAVSSLYNVLTDERLNHRVEVTGGVMEKECSGLLTGFFKLKREGKI